MGFDIGKRTWAIPEGYIPDDSHGPEPEMTSHGTLSFLNAGAVDAHVELYIYFSDRDPQGPYRIDVPARRTKHVRFNDLDEPAPVPRATEFSSLVLSDVPIVVQHTRLDSRQARNALFSTIAYPGND